MLEQYYRINQAAGVSIHTCPDGQVVVQLCSVVAGGNQLNIGKKVSDLNNIELLLQHIPTRSIIALNLSGKGILQKQIEKTETIDQGNFSKVLPNANIENFYVQNFVSGESSFVSVIRKADADGWISQLTEMGFKVMMLSLGAFPIENVISQLNIYDSDFSLDGHNIKRNDKLHWTNYQYKESALSPFPLKLASERIDEKLVISYAAAFQLVLANQLEPVQAQVGLLEGQLQKKLADNKIKVQGFVILIVLFTLLLVNFIFFSWLNTSNAVLTDQVSRYAQNTSNLQDIKDKVNKKESELKTLGWDGGINKSALIDQVSSLLPQEVNLTEIAVNPVDQANSRTQKTLVFFNRKIRIIGTSDKIIPVNEWIARIKTRHWVNGIQMESYTYDSELNTGRFLITIDY